MRCSDRRRVFRPSPKRYRQVINDAMEIQAGSGICLTLARLLEGIEAKVAEDALIASNTSSIPLETLGQGRRPPERLVSLHFFNPVAKMQLVEVIHTDANHRPWRTLPSGSGVEDHPPI